MWPRSRLRLLVKVPGRPVIDIPNQVDHASRGGLFIFLDLEQGQTELAMEQASLATQLDGCSAESIELRDALNNQLASAKIEHTTR